MPRKTPTPEPESMEPAVDPTSAPADTTSPDSAGPESAAAKPRARKVTEPTKDQLAAAAMLEDEAAKRPIIVKLARIMEGLPEFKPEGRNQHFNYDFIKDTQISGALRSRLAKERVMIVPDVVEETMVEVPTQRGRSFLTKLKIKFTAIDGDSGDEISGHGFGYGDDSGDKGANKAFTAALKYWLMKLMMIGGEDNESDPRADVRAGEREAGGTGPVREVKVDGAKIEGVERGGQQVKITEAQRKQILKLYQDLEFTPEKFVDAIDAYLNDKLTVEPDGDITAELNKYVKSLSADDAGKLITSLVEEKDRRSAQSEGLGGGYG